MGAFERSVEPNGSHATHRAEVTRTPWLTARWPVTRASRVFPSGKGPAPSSTRWHGRCRRAGLRPCGTGDREGTLRTRVRSGTTPREPDPSLPRPNGIDAAAESSFGGEHAPETGWGAVLGVTTWTRNGQRWRRDVAASRGERPSPGASPVPPRTGGRIEVHRRIRQGSLPHPDRGAGQRGER